MRQRSLRIGRAGFTLVEMMIVVVIAALAAAVVLPGMSGTLRNTGIKKSLRDTASLFRYARGRAVSRKVTTTVTIDLNNRKVTVDSIDPVIKLANANPDEEDDRVLNFSDEEQPTPRGGGKELRREKELHEELQLAWESFFSSDLKTEGTVEIKFFSKGNCQGGILYLANDDGQGYHIYLDPVTGLPEISTELLDLPWAEVVYEDDYDDDYDDDFDRY